MFSQAGDETGRKEKPSESLTRPSICVSKTKQKKSTVAQSEKRKPQVGHEKKNGIDP